MLPEVWQEVQRLLLIGFKQQIAELPLLTILQQLRQGLPLATYTLLAIYSADDEASFQLLPDDWPPEVLKQGIDRFWAITSPRSYQSLAESIHRHNFDAALILNTPNQSPYALAYLCYWAGIPLRVGVSQEFGGGVLSTCVRPPLDLSSWLSDSFHLSPIAC